MAHLSVKIVILVMTLLTSFNRGAHADPQPSSPIVLSCGPNMYRCDQNNCELIVERRGTNGALILPSRPENRQSFLSTHPLIPQLYIHADGRWLHCSVLSNECYSRGTNNAIIFSPSSDSRTMTASNLMTRADQISYEGRLHSCRNRTACRQILTSFTRASMPYRGRPLPANSCTYPAPVEVAHPVEQQGEPLRPSPSVQGAPEAHGADD